MFSKELKYLDVEGPSFPFEITSDESNLVRNNDVSWQPALSTSTGSDPWLLKMYVSYDFVNWF